MELSTRQIGIHLGEVVVLAMELEGLVRPL